ncbi:uncharacterized protein LOC143082265 [Mytilus galloprovincialis]|uniref:uncharacterized protein LOC143082265 n=1 Tax=Mytilus galloprovincialis TaxID=29158 RepID=UPI003F7C3C54
MTTMPYIQDFVMSGAKTRPRLIRDHDGNVWFLDNILQRHFVPNITSSCIVKNLENVTILPLGKPVSQNAVRLCGMKNNLHILAVVSKKIQFKMSWNPAIDANLIHDYEVGLSSTENSIAPDIVSFRTTKHHTHFRLNHPDVPDGKEFYIIIKSISKAGVEGLQSIGPFIVDTTKPRFSGSNIDVNLINDFLIANWTADAFEDPDDPYPMYFKYAVGHRPNMYDIQSFQNLQIGGPCKRTVPATCTALSVSHLKWSLHGHHDYYFTIKATNLAGLSVIQTSLRYTHDIQLPAEGIVMDVIPTSNLQNEAKDIEDRDFTPETTSLAVRWTGFIHPHQHVNYSACIGTVPSTCDTSAMKTLETYKSYTFTGLNLQPFQKYYVTLEAGTTGGSVKVSSDGIRVLDIHTNLTGIVIRDGNNCSVAPDLKLSHHSKDTRPTCVEDVEFQSSTTSLHVYWSIPSMHTDYIRDAFVQLEERVFGDIWKENREFQYVGKHQYITLSHLDLEPGKTYRAVVKFCAEDLCFPPVYGNGLTVIVNPSSSGNITVQQVDEPNRHQLSVIFERMYDPDIKDHTEAQSVVDYYEWALGDNVGIHTVWNEIDNATVVDIEHIQFIVPLNNSLDFSKCRKIFIRGYNKAGIWSTISTEIKTCKIDEGDSLIVSNVVIDAIGQQEISMDGAKRDGYGRDVYLQENGRWDESDVDYTPYKNIISGVWPLLRHKNYTWAVIDSENLDITSYYKDDDKLQLKDPCSHPDSIKCGFTDKEYVNVIFNLNEELEHGKRYLVCIHAPRTEIQYEKWTEVLEETNTCSDGVTVDLTPPTPGHVWIGIDPDRKCQSSSSDIFVSWDSFTDVEEYKKTVHSSGIKEYQIGIGSTKGGTDVFPYTIVGLVNHYTIHDVRLQNGHEYYATVKALDFATRSAIADSHPVKIDATPPEKSDKPITIEGRHMSDMSEINACWRDVFLDKDSGIDHYLWSVGSHPGHDDIIPFTKTTLDCGVSAEDTNINIHEGHAYFITVKAVNRANLISTASSWAYIYDMSPPVAGHVYDGSVEAALSYMKDRDYQTDVKTLSAYWEGFHDPHSTIKSYYVSIGTCPECEDLLVNQDIGITYNYTLCHMHLGSGIRYYTTITACNTADMCTSVTSDGVVIDNSPPTQGIVLDGVDVYDLEYQSLRRYLSARWYGFTDPQSGIEKFSWRAGTKPGQDDIVKSTHLPQTDLLVEPDLPQKLPLGQRIYITIKAYNKAGLTTEATSNGFYIDNSPPSIKVKPYLSADVGSIKDTSVVFRSTIKIQWEVEDKESFIQRQYLSIASHKGGEFNTSSTELNGIVREYTFSQLDLHDGGNYSIKLIVCNGAKVCVEDESRGIIVDSSPPTPGMFAIRTDHAANLHRHVNGWMTWSRYKLWISWLGFTDLHTGIEKYSVSIGSKYMMDDFNKISGSPQEFLHNQSGIDKHDEGFVQTFEVDTKNLAKFENVFVSVWAVNQIGLQSKMIHSQFKLVPGGSLELIRRCSAVTCQGHCVCAAQGQRCTKRSCHDVTKANNNNLLGIYDITNIQESSPFTDIKYTPSNVALAAKWHVIQAQGLRPLWYEWTAGYSDKDEPEGIFDNLNDDVWHHAGQTNQAILNIKRGQRLKESPVSYSMFVRAWYNDDTYADFKTDGILVMSTPLPRRKIKGSAVVEQIPGHWKKDVDYLKPGAPFTVKWTNVFKDDANIIAKFKVYLSTYPGGHDIHEVELDLPGSVTSHNISRVPLSPGKVFYSNVVGYSYSGIHATETSDGIMVDSLPPVTGTVYDGIGMHDTEYQNNSKLVGASWHGFSDRDSGITNYMWCVQTKSASVPCDIKDWENVGIHHSVSRVLNSSHINTGEEVESLVYAVDGIGYRSKTSKSNGVMIDTTHPEPTLMEHLEHNIAANPSFEDVNGQAIDWDNITNTNFCNNLVYAMQWNNSLGSCVGVLKSGKNVAIDGRSFIFVEGQISQSLDNLNVGHIYRVTFVTAHPPILGAVLANKEGYIELGNTRHVFMVYTKQDKHGSALKELNWHHHTFYFRPSTTTETINLGSMTGNTGILFDDVKIQETILHNHDEANQNGKHIHVHVVALHQWSSIHASWSFVDSESPIVDYMWAIGYTEGSTEVQGFTSVGLNNFAYNYNVSLAHTSVIHITVIATNAAELRREAHAEDLLVDLTAPYIRFVNDGIGSDIDAQTTEEVSANWEVNDAESGIDVCEWAVGYQPYGNEIQTFQPLASGVKRISKVFPSSQVSMQMIHVTLRCKNEAGLQSSKSSNGVKISSLPPNTNSAEVQILPHTLTEYNPRDHYQGDTSSIRVKWTGFEDLTGLDSYLLTLQSHDKSTSISKSIIAENQDMSYCLFEGLDISNGNYSASVNAVNKMYLRSTQVTSQIVVSQMSPLLIENQYLLMDLNNRTITASWKDHFQVQQPIYYEVSAGTILGGADIIQWQETKNTFLEFQLPPKIKSVKDLTGYITVRGVSANGMTTLVNAAVKL